MKREIISDKAQDYVSRLYAENEYPDYASEIETDVSEAFEDGARWRIDSVWHDMREKPEREDECLLVEYRDLGVDRSDYEVIASEDFERCCSRKSTIFIRWAYINDLLPE